ncbi:hypothetical protein DYY66_2050 [Candidatus Nitrosotalea sp. FS]|uniref:hypothetical protein n=1 Tax=Candidatus Nitrosotalea sp. FS TaxID=2341021 RepID=UPI0014083519|nr:hypothetical protein [Candidatus Nitrosotalea sp. FS]NHH96717.1 hypothetical protein [Candidatus Nitrosotalea sp. FS]
MFVLNMNNSQAEEIARTFLSQSYSVIRIEKSELVDQTWIVQVLVLSFDKETRKKVKINNRTGYIVGFE